jgi:hypothetical protein
LAFKENDMQFSQEPTRELAICLTAPYEALLRKRLAVRGMPNGFAIRTAIRQPFRKFEENGAVMRFWNWDNSSDGEHPVVGMLMEFIRDAPPQEYWFLRIVADDNVLEEAGCKNAFACFGIKVVQAPRILF